MSFKRQVWGQDRAKCLWGPQGGLPDSRTSQQRPKGVRSCAMRASEGRQFQDLAGSSPGLEQREQRERGKGRDGSKGHSCHRGENVVTATG